MVREGCDRDWQRKEHCGGGGGGGPGGNARGTLHYRARKEIEKGREEKEGRKGREEERVAVNERGEGARGRPGGRGGGARMRATAGLLMFGVFRRSCPGLLLCSRPTLRLGGDSMVSSRPAFVLDFGAISSRGWTGTSQNLVRGGRALYSSPRGEATPSGSCTRGPGPRLRLLAGSKMAADRSCPD